MASLRHLYPLLLLALLGLPPVPSVAQYALIGEDREAAGPMGWAPGASKAEIIARVLATWALDDEFYGSVLVAYDGVVVFEDGFGLASIEHRIANTPETRFMTGYISMYFTVFGIVQLADQGLLTLDAPVSSYLPTLTTEHYDRITLRHLITHRSGLDQDLFRYTDKTPYDYFTPEELTALIDRVALDDEPGTTYRFAEVSSSNYLLLGHVIETITGQRFESYIEEQVIRPLGLANTGFVHRDQPVAGLATPYLSLFDRFEPAPSLNYSFLYPSGALYSTVRDVYRFFMASAGGELLGPEGQELLLRLFFESTFAIQEGVLTRDLSDVAPEEVLHYADTNGWIEGYTSLFGHFLDQGHFIVVLSNVHRATQIYDIRRRWARTAFGLPVGLPLPKGRRPLWTSLFTEGVDAAAERYRHYQEEGINTMPLRDEFMFLSRELRKRSEVEKALLVSELFVALEPDSWLPYRELGEVYRLMGQAEQARSAFRKALSLAPDHEGWKRDMEVFLSQ